MTAKQIATRRHDLFHADKPETCEACRNGSLHTFEELCEYHPKGTGETPAEPNNQAAQPATDDKET